MQCSARAANRRSKSWVAFAFSMAMVAASARAEAQRASADRVYVVQSGDTLSRVAQRLQVPPMELAARNYLQRPYALRVGRQLRLPAGVPQEVLRTLPRRDGGAASARAVTPGAVSARVAPSQPGMATLRREGEDSLLIGLRSLDTRGARRLMNYLRFEAAAPVPVHPRLVFVLSTISDHFGGRAMRVQANGVPHGSEPRGPSSNHPRGTAIDLRVDGTSLVNLHAFCLTLDRVGCGLHRGANYVHIDVRREGASWDDTGAIMPIAARRR